MLARLSAIRNKSKSVESVARKSKTEFHPSEQISENNFHRYFFTGAFNLVTLHFAD